MEAQNAVDIRQLEAPGSTSYRLGKRILDIGAAASLLFLLSPLLAMVAIVVLLNLGRPIIFRQLRIGRLDRPFVLYKFRTMRRCAADAPPRQMVPPQRNIEAQENTIQQSMILQQRTDDIDQPLHPMSARLGKRTTKRLERPIARHADTGDALSAERNDTHGYASSEKIQSPQQNAPVMTNAVVTRPSADPTPATETDAARMTPLGTWLRSWSLDELPQLWNILRGDMSFIGPRPLLPEYLPRYSTIHRLRHLAPPGLSGWAQIHGRNACSWQTRLDLDVQYVRQASFALDFKIARLTMLRVLRREGITQPGSATMPVFQGLDPNA